MKPHAHRWLLRGYPQHRERGRNAGWRIRYRCDCGRERFVRISAKFMGR